MNNMLLYISIQRKPKCQRDDKLFKTICWSKTWEYTNAVVPSGIKMNIEYQLKEGIYGKSYCIPKNVPSRLPSEYVRQNEGEY